MRGRSFPNAASPAGRAFDGRRFAGHAVAAAASRVAATLLLAGCAASSPPPDWQANAHLALANFERAYLVGNSSVADREFTRTRTEVSSTGRVDLVARVELARCAVQVASLVFDDCAGYAPLAADAAPEERAYAQYIAGLWQAMDAKRLPPQHRAVVASGTLPADPLSRLVAAGALFRTGRLPPAGVRSAIDAASDNGWRRPLLAWLGVEARLASDAGDTANAARIQRRIELVTRGGDK
ncbi:MAG: hypothetical protein ABI630_06555 [Betaproteobacteria bacterium]